MHVDVIPTGPFQQNCILVCNDQKQALVCDPGYDPDRIVSRLKTLELEVNGYIITHAHADHINALADLHKVRPAPVIIHSLDLQWAFSEFNQIAPYYPAPREPVNAAYLALEKQRDWQWNGFSFQCIETPGHSPGSCCLLFADTHVMLSGDTLFRGSCGRTDLPGGDPRQMRLSLNKLKQLPDDVRVYPGHGPDTTIGIERRTNYHMQ